MVAKVCHVVARHLISVRARSAARTARSTTTPPRGLVGGYAASTSFGNARAGAVLSRTCTGARNTGQGAHTNPEASNEHGNLGQRRAARGAELSGRRLITRYAMGLAASRW